MLDIVHCLRFTLKTLCFSFWLLVVIILIFFDISHDKTLDLSNVLRFLKGDDIKPCPRCQVLIVKMDDGSCNHMTCAVCGAEFCWLCMKEISDLHYLR